MVAAERNISLCLALSNSWSGAFLFPYRYVFRGVRYPDALNDLQQAMRYVKAYAEDYGIDTARVAAMGFSAGGHLVMSAAELLPKAERPYFMVPIYPVVTMVESCVHKRSRRALLGDSRMKNRALRDLLSLERHVPTDCPPVFLVNCKDDPIVKYQNSELLDSALTSQKAPHRYIQYQTGGHGFELQSVKVRLSVGNGKGVSVLVSQTRGYPLKIDVSSRKSNQTLRVFQLGITWNSIGCYLKFSFGRLRFELIILI